jgi:hypothetical protein
MYVELKNIATKKVKNINRYTSVYGYLILEIKGNGERNVAHLLKVHLKRVKAKMIPGQFHQH